MPTPNKPIRKVPKSSATILDKARYLIEASRNQVEVVKLKLTDLLNPPPVPGEPGEPRVDWGAVQLAQIGYLEASTEEASAAGQAHRASKVAVTDAMKWRDKVHADCLKHYRQLRALFKLVYTVLRWHLLDLDQPLERPHSAQRERWRDFHQHLLDPGMPDKLGEPEEDQEAIDLEKAGASFGARFEKYEEALDRVTEARKRRDEALVAKLQAEDRLRVVYANVARTQEAHFRMVGLDELAARIRLTIPKTLKKVEDNGSSEPPPPA